MPAGRDTRLEAARLRRLAPLQTVENQSRAWGLCCHSCTWRKGLAPLWKTELQGESSPRGLPESQSFLLCEFARKKENPSLERYITPLLSTFSYILAQSWEARLTIASFSAELPVIRGHGRSPASSCLFVRDQKPAYASHFRPCWP